ncbi:MAG: T9SS type A sorting domain-containing protein [Bacteroidales bacterium]|nr:T9SS type A sorting domain-containing protein [Bacteroidales bacterium]
MKKKLLISIILMMVVGLSVIKADIILQTTHVTYTPGTEFTIPMLIYGAGEEGTPVSAMNIIFTFDTTAVQFLQFVNFNPLVPQNQWFFSGNNITGTVAANWIEPNLGVVAIPDGTAVYYVKFKAKPGVSPFTFITHEFLDEFYNDIPTITQNGSYASIQQVLFQVNMRDQDVSPDGVHLAGSFNGWSATATPMTVGESTTYSVTLPLISDSIYYYRFVNGNNESGYEIVPAECGVQAGDVYNRMINNPGVDSTLAEVCFSSCSACPPQSVVTFQVDMRDQAISPDGVHLAGSFNNWSVTSTPMTLISGTVYSVDLPLLSDSTYTYKFVNGNSESGYETVPAECGVPDGNSYNRLVQLTQNDTIIPIVCFSYCSTCPPLAQITFRVEMNLESIDPAGVHIAGSFNNWSPSETSLNNLGGGIYGITIPAIIGSEVEYLFVNGNTSGDFEIVPSECGVPDEEGNFNRFIVTPDNDSTLSVVCFSRCSVCPPTHNVTFRVDMAQQSISPDGIHLAGSFNDFDPVSIPMVNQGNDVFSTTIELVEGEIILFRYVNGADAIGFETVPEACGTDDGTGNYYRSFTVIEYDLILDEVCFSECEDCVQPPGQTDVTFMVDMNRETVSPDGIHVAGTFNNWNTESNLMINQGNNIYSIMLTLNENDVHQYRFVNGNTTDGYETVPAECGFEGNSGGLERQITIPVQDTTYENVCFSSCSACVVYELTVQVDMMLELIDPAGVHLAGNFNGWNADATEMISSGSSIYEAVLQIYEGDTLVYRFVNGAQQDDMEIVPGECGWIYNGQDYARIVIPSTDTILPGICFSKCDSCTVGIEEMAEGMTIGELFPNPAASYVNIPVENSDPIEFTVFVNDITGKTLQANVYTLPQGYHDVKLDIQNFPDGLYFIHYITEGENTFKQSAHKLLISR